LAHLRGLSNLDSLDLAGCAQVTDEGLDHLRGLSNLRLLNLSQCAEVTVAGLGKLKRLLPHCRVVV
jgi:hypothetical protein